MKIFNEFLNFYAVAFHGKSYCFIMALPLAVKRLRWSGLVGFSGTVISISPSSKSGWMFRLNERESPCMPM